MRINIRQVVQLGNKFYNLRAKNMELLSPDFLHCLLGNLKKLEARIIRLTDIS